jgi:hypothetical protein
MLDNFQAKNVFSGKNSIAIADMYLIKLTGAEKIRAGLCCFLGLKILADRPTILNRVER